MKLKYNVMTVVAGLALAAALPVNAQLLGGALGGAGTVVMGGGGIAGNGSASGTLNSDLGDRVQAARERTQSAAESTAEHGRDAAASTRASAEGRVQKTRTGTEQAANSASAAGSTASSASAEKRVGKRTVKADSSTSGDFQADRNAAAFGGSHATSASITRDAPTPASPEAEPASN